MLVIYLQRAFFSFACDGPMFVLEPKHPPHNDPLGKRLWEKSLSQVLNFIERLFSRRFKRISIRK